MGGHDPYSSSKGCAELVTSAFRRSFYENASIIAVASARAGNVIGGGDWSANRIIPDAIRSFSSNQQLQVRSPDAIRPWQHVLEPLSGYLKLAEQLFIYGIKYAAAWNFGPEECDTKSVEWIVNKMSKIWESEVCLVYDEGDHPHEANYLKRDCSKANNILLWRPKWNLNIALEKIIEWNKKTNDNGNYRRCCVHQIDEYMSH